jgi:hypothetical protein
MQETELKTENTENHSFFVMKAGGDMPKDIVDLCKVMGLFKEE